jgi:tRNA threonylcarbamoyladenosine biosynthesis protein TsaB
VILAIDTTNARGSIALADGDRLLEEMPLEAPDGYSEILFGAIERLLEKHGVSIGQIDLFAATSGPGTFTGVRVGLACVKGLAEALGRPVCAVSNLQALASMGSSELRAAILDARRGEVYAAVYDSAGREVLPECLTSRDLLELDPGIEVVAYEGPLAAAVARIAARRFRSSGDVSDPATIEANYIRRSDAELHLTVRTSSLPRT